MEIGITGHIFGRGPSKDHSTIVWLQLVKCEKLTDGRKVIAIAHMASRPGELKKRNIC